MTTVQADTIRNNLPPVICGFTWRSRWRPASARRATSLSNKGKPRGLLSYSFRTIKESTSAQTRSFQHVLEDWKRSVLGPYQTLYGRGSPALQSAEDQCEVCEVQQHQCPGMTLDLNATSTGDHHSAPRTCIGNGPPQGVCVKITSSLLCGAIGLETKSYGLVQGPEDLDGRRMTR